MYQYRSNSITQELLRCHSTLLSNRFIRALLLYLPVLAIYRQCEHGVVAAVGVVVDSALQNIEQVLLLASELVFLASASL